MGMVFQGSTRVYKRICRFNSKWGRKKEKCATIKWILRNLFCYFSNLSNDDKISWRPGLKTGMKSANFWSELGSGIGELGSTPPPGIPRNTPPGLRRSDPQPHRNISELTFIFPMWYLVGICGERTFGWDQGLLAIGLWWEPLNNYLLRYSHGSPASFLIHFLDIFLCGCNSFQT